MEIIRNTPSNSSKPNPDSFSSLISDNFATPKPEFSNPVNPANPINPTNSANSPTILKITKISPAIKNQNRVNVFINEAYSFSLDLAQLVDLKLKVDQVLTPAQLAECQSASEFGKLYQSALEWVLARPRSVQETRDYFKRKQLRRTASAKNYQNSQNYLHSEAFLSLDRDRRSQIKKSQPKKPAPPLDPQMVEKVIAKLIEKNYLNDEVFAEYYVEYRHVKKGISLKKLRLELAQKGITSSIIDQTFAKIPRDDTAEIQKIIAKKRRRYPDDEKLIQYLLRQGFPYELAKTAVRETDSQNSE